MKTMFMGRCRERRLPALIHSNFIFLFTSYSIAISFKMFCSWEVSTEEEKVVSYLSLGEKCSNVYHPLVTYSILHLSSMKNIFLKSNCDFGRPTLFALDKLLNIFLTEGGLWILSPSLLLEAH